MAGLSVADIEDSLSAINKLQYQLTPLGSMVAGIENSVLSLSTAMGELTRRGDAQIKLQAMTVHANNTQIEQNAVLNNIATKSFESSEQMNKNIVNQNKLMQISLRFQHHEYKQRMGMIPAINAQSSAIQGQTATLEEQTAAQKAAKKVAYDSLNPFQKLAKVLGESDADSFAGKFHRFGFAFIPFYFSVKNKMEMVARTAGKMWEGLFGNKEDGKPRTGLGKMAQAIKKQMNLFKAIDPESEHRGEDEQGKKKGTLKSVGEFVTAGNPLAKLFKILKNPLKNIDKAVTFSYKFYKKIRKKFYKLIQNGLVLGAVVMKYMIIIALIAVGARLLWKKSGMTVEKLKDIATRIWKGIQRGLPFIIAGFNLIWSGISTIFGAWMDIVLGNGDPMEALTRMFYAVGEILWGIASVWYGIFGIRLKELGVWLFENKEEILTWVGEKTIAFALWIGGKIAEYWGKLSAIYEKQGAKMKRVMRWAVLIVGAILLIVAIIATLPVWLGLLLFVAGALLVAWAMTKFDPFMTAFNKVVDALVKISEKANPKNWKIFGGEAKADGGIAKGGITLVGEEGPELVNLNAGARVYNNSDTNDMLGKGGTTNITVNVQGRIGASDSELRQIAEKVGGMINKEINRTTSSSTTR